MNVGVPFSVRLRCGLSLALTPLLTSACDDNLRQDWVAIPDTVLLYSLSRPDLIGRPSAFDFINGVPVEVENPSASGRWDMAVSDQGTGMAFVPAGAFAGISSRAGIATMTGATFETLEAAPADTARYSSAPVLAELGKVYVVRSRRENCGFGNGSRYAKMEVVEVNRTAGTLRFRTITNPYCNDRKLIPPD